MVKSQSIEETSYINNKLKQIDLRWTCERKKGYYFLHTYQKSVFFLSKRRKRASGLVREREEIKPSLRQTRKKLPFYNKMLLFFPLNWLNQIKWVFLWGGLFLSVILGHAHDWQFPFFFFFFRLMQPTKVTKVHKFDYRKLEHNELENGTLKNNI